MGVYDDDTDSYCDCDDCLDDNGDWDDDPTDTGPLVPVAYQGNSALGGTFTREEEVDMVGTTFATRNKTVSTLPVGAVLTVVGQGQLQVSSVPQVQLKAGDRFLSKYGPATAIRVTTTYDLNEIVDDAIPEGSVVYVADGTNVVRVTSAAGVKLIK